MSTLYSYQQELARRNDKFSIDVKARQIGYSFAFAWNAFQRAWFEGKNQLLVSRTNRQAAIVMGYIEKWVRIFNVRMLVDQKTQKTLSNNAMLLSLPPNPDTIRGFPGDVFLDEFAIYKNDKEVYEAMLPSTLRGYSLTVSSTPLGCNNMFYHIYNNTDNKYPDFKRYSLNIYEAVEKGLNVDIDIIKRNYDEDSFRQEFMCEFIDDASSYFTYELLRSCLGEFENIKGEHFLGIDIGRTKDRTVIADIIRANGHYYLTRLEVLDRMPFPEQKAIIKQVFHETNASDIQVDMGSIGYQLAEELKNEIHARGVSMNNPVKVEITTLTKKHMENKTFHISESIPEKEQRDLITDFHSISKNITATNLIQFNSPRDETGHGDRAWATMLAMRGACRKIARGQQW